MDAQSRRHQRRKPLCDLTNASSISSTTTAYKSKLRPRSSMITNSAICSSTALANPSSREARASSQIGLQISSSSVCGAANYESDEHSTLKMSRKEDKETDVEKDNSAISALSHPLSRKNRITGRLKQAGGSLASTDSVPCQKKKKRKRQIKTTEYELSQDFIEQRAYFEEVDAFELCEELISDSEP